MCGAVTFVVRGVLENLCFCHCESCRRASGAPFVAWGTCNPTDLEIEGELASYRSSPPVTRGFCSRCGTSVTYAHESRPGEIDIALATLDDPAALKPAYHLWVSEKLPWISIDDSLPQYAGWRKA